MMKRIYLLLTIIAVLTAGLATVYGAGFQLSQPDEAGGSLVATHLDGLQSSSSAGPGLDLFIRYRLSPKFMISAGTGIATIMDKSFAWDFFKTTLFPNVEIKGILTPSQNPKVVPMIFAGLNAFGSKWTAKTPSGTISGDKIYYDAGALVGGGLQLAINEKVSFHATGDYRYIFSVEGNPKPKYWVAKAGLTFALNQTGRTFQKEDEIEYPVGDQELSNLDDLFKEDKGKKGKDEDALSLLFQPEQGAAGSKKGGTGEEDFSDLFGAEESGVESSMNYPDTEIGQLMAKVDGLKSQMDQKSQQIDMLQSQVQANEKTLSEIAGGGIAGGPALSDNEFKSKYAAALDLFHMKQYKSAIKEFQAIAASNSRHMLASNCHYWMGESFNAMGDYRKALAEFATVMTYKSSYKFDDALIMSGLCYMKLGDSDNARNQFQELVSRYPESEYAPKAMRYLGSL